MYLPLVASTFGDLVPLTFTAPLWGNKKPKGAHLHIEWDINTSLGFKGLSLGTLSLLVKSQIYGEIDGNPDAGQLISGLLNSDTDIASPFSSALIEATQPQSALFQLAATADMLLTLKLHEIFKLPGIEIEVPLNLGNASFLLEYQYERDDETQSWIDCRFSLASDIKGGIKEGLKKFLDGKGLGTLMSILSVAIDAVKPDSPPMEGMIMLRVYGNGDFDFGLEASLNFLTGGSTPWCGLGIITYVS